MSMKRSVSVDDLERFHQGFVAMHASHSRRKFFNEFARPLEFKGEAMRASTYAAQNRGIEGRRLETTNQFRFRAPEELPSHFRPTREHCITKAPEHDWYQQIFTLKQIDKGFP